MREKLLLLLFFAASPGAFTQELDGCFPGDAITPDRSSIYLVCENGMGLRRGDAGPWEPMQIAGRGRVRAAHFLTKQRGFVAGDSGLVLGTSDGGKTWRRLEAGTSENLKAIYALGDWIWVAGFGGVVFHSEDNGGTWKPQRTFTTRPIESIYFVDEKNGWAAGWSGLLLRTTDGGNSWQQLSLPGVWETLSAIRFRDHQNGWVVGMYGAMLRTRDGGATWQRQPVPTRSWLTALDFSPGGTAWIAAEYHFLRSDDGGESWQLIPHDSPIAVTTVIATKDAVFAFGPGFMLTRSGRDSAWLRTNLDEIVHRAGSSLPSRRTHWCALLEVLYDSLAVSPSTRRQRHSEPAVGGRTVLHPAGSRR